MAAMAIDGLIDGMDLTEQWCIRYLSQSEDNGVEYALSRVQGKLRRIGYYQDNTVTCIVANEAERERLLKVPGREMSPSSATVNRYGVYWKQFIEFLDRH